MRVGFFFLVRLVVCYYIDEKYRNRAVEVDVREDQERNMYISFTLNEIRYASVVHLEKIQRLGRNSFTTYNAVYTKKYERKEQTSVLSLKDALENAQGWFIRENATGALSGVLVDNNKVIHIKPKHFLFPSAAKTDLIAFVVDDDYPEYVCKPLEESGDVFEFEDPLEDNRTYFEKAAGYFKTRAERGEEKSKQTFIERVKNILPKSIRNLVFWWDPVKTHEEVEDFEETESNPKKFEELMAPETQEEIRLRKKQKAVRREIEKQRELPGKTSCQRCSVQSMYKRSQKSPGSSTDKVSHTDSSPGASIDIIGESNSKSEKSLSAENSLGVAITENTFRNQKVNMLGIVNTHTAQIQSTILNNVSEDFGLFECTEIDSSYFSPRDKTFIDPLNSPKIEEDENLSGFDQAVLPVLSVQDMPLLTYEEVELLNNPLLARAALSDISPSAASAKDSSGSLRGGIAHTHLLQANNKASGPYAKVMSPKKKVKKIPKKKLSKKEIVDTKLIRDLKDRAVGNTFVTTKIPKSNKLIKKGEMILLGIPYYSRIAQIESAIRAPSNYGFPIEKKAIPVAVAIDSHYIEKLGSKREAIFSVLENMNIASRIYEKSFNVMLYVTDIIIDPNADWFYSVASLTQKLDQFEKYRARKKKKCMIYHLVTASVEKTTQIGLAWRGAIGFNSKKNISASVFTQNQFITIAHEIGHNLGLVHDCDSKTCKNVDPLNYPCNPCDGCDCKGQYIMNSKKVQNLLAFSPPTQREMSIILANLDLEIPKARDVNIPYPICGNGIVEQGEECDAGPFGDACCTPDCKLRIGAICSDFNSGCCKGCQPMRSGAVCKKGQNECQKDSVCNGVSAECPAASFFPNKKKCSLGFCASGVCTNKDSQCVLAGDRRSIVSALPGYKGCTMKCVNRRGDAVTLGNKAFRDGTPCGWNGSCQQGRCVKDLGLAAITVLAFIIGMLLVGLALI